MQVAQPICPVFVAAAAAVVQAVDRPPAHRSRHTMRRNSVTGFRERPSSCEGCSGRQIMPMGPRIARTRLGAPTVAFDPLRTIPKRSGQFPWSGGCFDLRTITKAGTSTDCRRAVQSHCAIQRLHGRRVRMFEREGTQSRTQIGNCGHRARLATPVDDGGSRPVERKRAVMRNGEIKRWIDRR